MKKTKEYGEDQALHLQGAISLAFRVKAHEDNLFSAEMLLLEDDKVIDRKYGAGTTLGHAMAAADDLMDGWAFNEVEQNAKDFFTNVTVY